MNGPGVISHFLQAMGAHPRFPNFVCCCHKSYFVSPFQGVFIIKKSIHHTSLKERERQREHFCRVWGIKEQGRVWPQSAYVLDRGPATLYQVSFLYVQSYCTCGGEVQCLYTLRDRFARLFLCSNSLMLVCLLWMNTALMDKSKFCCL